MSNDNSQQIEFWNGSTAINWVAAEERMDELLAPLSQHVIKRADIQAGEAAIDIGCGCGGTSRAMAAAGARVLGIDISTPMLDRAKAQQGTDGQTEFIEADAANYSFDANFDLLFSRFGVMFFADPVAAFANLRSALKPTGRLCFICWQAISENAWLAVPTAAAQPFLPAADAADAPDPLAPGPFSFADPEHLSQVLNDAGFSDVAVEAYPVEMQVGENLAEAMEFYTQVGPLSGVLGSLEPQARESAVAAVEQALISLKTDNGFALPGGCWIATALR
jgi:ubiquinone/menaquinone biosynthesis C-methylase UbiE